MTLFVKVKMLHYVNIRDVRIHRGGGGEEEELPAIGADPMPADSRERVPTPVSPPHG